MKKFVISLVIVFAIVGTWFVLKKDTEPTSTPTPAPAPTQQSNTVTYTNAGYSPAKLTIKKGQTVTWKNESSFLMWTASAVHPTNKVYPGTDISMCGERGEAAMFDACKGISSGQEWSFKFNNAGTWKYHNHMKAAHSGTIIVEP